MILHLISLVIFVELSVLFSEMLSLETFAKFGLLKNILYPKYIPTTATMTIKIIINRALDFILNIDFQKFKNILL